MEYETHMLFQTPFGSFSFCIQTDLTLNVKLWSFVFGFFVSYVLSTVLDIQQLKSGLISVFIANWKMNIEMFLFGLSLSRCCVKYQQMDEEIQQLTL